MSYFCPNGISVFLKPFASITATSIPFPPDAISVSTGAVTGLTANSVAGAIDIFSL